MKPKPAPPADEMRMSADKFDEIMRKALQVPPVPAAVPLPGRVKRKGGVKRPK